jgi:hypothetical protein
MRAGSARKADKPPNLAIWNYGSPRAELLRCWLPGCGGHARPGFRFQRGTEGFCALNKRRYTRCNSQSHTEGVYVTPFTGTEPVHDRDSANNAASTTDYFPVNSHFSSSRVSSVESPSSALPQYRARNPGAHDPYGMKNTWRQTVWAA